MGFSCSWQESYCEGELVAKLAITVWKRWGKMLRGSQTPMKYCSKVRFFEKNDGNMILNLFPHTSIDGRLFEIAYHFHNALRLISITLSKEFYSVCRRRDISNLNVFIFHVLALLKSSLTFSKGNHFITLFRPFFSLRSPIVRTLSRLFEKNAVW